MRFAVIGGDERMARLVGLLKDDGHEVRAFLLPEGEQDAASAVSGAEYVILPAPTERGKGLLNAALAGETVTTEAIVKVLRPGQRVLAGCVTPDFRGMCAAAGVDVIDYFTREELTIKNADLTAEGALGLLITETDFSLNGASILVVGAGRIGKLMATKLRALGANVTLSARKAKDLAFAEALGLAAADTGKLGEGEVMYDAVINTVPAPVVTETVLKRVRPGGYVMDLASLPGGVDFAAAKAMGVHAAHHLSIPGRMMPDAAAAGVLGTVYNILNELECSD